MRYSDQVVIVALLTVSLTTLQTKAQPKAPANNQARSALRIYFADVEGGQATLFVPPAGENLLIDTGNPSTTGRDSERILAICKQAGITKIDNVLITHYHNDHVGGLPEVAAKIPIGRLIDHGPNTETNDAATVRGWDGYQKVLATGKSAHLTVKPGDVLPLTGMHVEIVSADGKLISKPLPGGGARNLSCDTTPEKPLENTENDHSTGMVITFGKLRIVDLGDLTWAKERPLMCPTDRIGPVDIYIASHHGLDRSGSPVLVNAIAPRVVIMNNGPFKGGAPGAWDIIQHSPRITALWQLHTAEAADGHNVPDARIANLKGSDDGHSLELTARKDGSFAVTNQRTGETVQYPAK